MKKLHRLFFYFTAVMPLIILPGCLITTQSYNHGKLLNPGERIMTHGFGWRYSSRYLPHETWKDSAGITVYQNKRDSTRFGWFTYVFDYRVGVLRKYPFGRGLETGFHLELAYRGQQVISGISRHSYSEPQDDSLIVSPPLKTAVDTEYTTEPEFYGPPVLEIDTRFGLPDVIMRKSIFHHNVNAGWIVGYWVDNGWFLGYAAGWEFANFIPYLSTRLFISATDALNRSLGDKDYFAKHDRQWGGRITGGASYRLPFNFSVVPEFITPEISLTFPNYSTGQSVGFNASVGIRWMLGQ